MLKPNNRRIFFEAVLIMIFAGIFLLFPIDKRVYQEGDGQGYMILANNILSRGSYSLSEQPPFEPTVFREPAYPFFLFLMLWIGKGSIVSIMIGQAILLYLGALLAGRIASKLAGSRTGTLVRVVTLFYPTLVDYARFATSEILALFLLMLFIFCLLKIFQDSSWKWVLSASLALAMLILCKAMMLYFMVILLVLLIALKVKKVLLIRCLFTALLAYILIFPWMLRTHSLTGKWHVTSGREGVNIYVGAARIGYNWNEFSKNLVFNFSERLGRKIFPGSTDGLLSDTYTYKGIEEASVLMEALRARGLSEREIDVCLLKQGLDKIKLHPFKYIGFSVLEFEKMLAFNHLPSNSRNIGKDRNVNDRGIWRFLRYIYRLSGYPMFFLAVYGIWMSKDRWLDFLPLVSVLAYVNLFYSLVFAEGRHNVPTLPIIIFLDFIALKLILPRRIKAAI